ncbi:hypothetical protein EI94DRAFT_1810439 [Lactarius quietus]|nr:hypothetical protein EI94DRAFT_1810439 [Lactarius quietus]
MPTLYRPEISSILPSPFISDSKKRPTFAFHRRIFHDPAFAVELPSSPVLHFATAVKRAGGAIYDLVQDAHLVTSAVFLPKIVLRNVTRPENAWPLVRQPPPPATGVPLRFYDFVHRALLPHSAHCGVLRGDRRASIRWARKRVGVRHPQRYLIPGRTPVKDHENT